MMHWLLLHIKHKWCLQLITLIASNNRGQDIEVLINPLAGLVIEVQIVYFHACSSLVGLSFIVKGFELKPIYSLVFLCQFLLMFLGKEDVRLPLERFDIILENIMQIDWGH